MDTLTILKNTREKLAADWSRLNGYGNPATGECCIVGGLNVISHGWDVFCADLVPGTPEHLAATFIADAAGLDYDPEKAYSVDDAIANWNDADEREKDEVLKVMDMAIQFCEADAGVPA